MGARMKLRLYLGLALVVLGAVIVLQNSGPVVLRFLAWKAEVDGLLLYLILFLLGIGAGSLLTLALRFRFRES